MDRYGPVSKLSLMARPTVLVAGAAANKFVFFNRSLAMMQNASILRILGEKSIVAVHGDDHRRIRGALLEFLRPEMLKMYLGTVDAQVRQHIEENWAGRTTVTVQPLMKRLTFSIISALVVGKETGAARDALNRELVKVQEGTVALPVNLPFMAYGRSLRASRRARRLLSGVIREKKANLDPNSDLISRLLSMTDDHGQQLLSDEEIVDNTLATLIAAHDSTASLMTFMVRQLADDPATLAAMVQGTYAQPRTSSCCIMYKWCCMLFVC
jgi:cytochrome P450